MEAKQSIDKSSWGAGPWQDEPDRVEFEHEGFPCLITRSHFGHLCGYVAVPPGHPWHNVDLIDCGESPDVHGGITYARKCQGDVCHVPKPGELDDVWWLGFDHGHSGDFSPGLHPSEKAPAQHAVLSLVGRNQYFDRHESYKTLRFVRSGVESLAHQARLAGEGQHGN